MKNTKGELTVSSDSPRCQEEETISQLKEWHERITEILDVHKDKLVVKEVLHNVGK